MTDLIRSACLTSYPEIARSLGLDPMRLLDACGIDRRCLDDPDIKLPAGALGRLIELSAKAAGAEIISASGGITVFGRNHFLMLKDPDGIHLQLTERSPAP